MNTLFNRSTNALRGRYRQSATETRMTLTRTMQAAKKAITALSLAAGLFLVATSAAFADGLTTMHGFACNPAASDPNVIYGGALWNRGSAPITVVCPLTSAWGGGTDRPAQILSAQVHFLSSSRGSAISCTMFRQNTSGFVLEKNPNRD